jgi:non-homologous end joining protein Ku
VRSLDDVDIDLTPVGETELALALRLIEQIADDGYDRASSSTKRSSASSPRSSARSPAARLFATPAAPAPSAEVIDLVAALRASLGAAAGAGKRAAAATPRTEAGERKPVRRAGKARADTAASRAGDAAGAKTAPRRQSRR